MWMDLRLGDLSFVISRALMSRPWSRIPQVQKLVLIPLPVSKGGLDGAFLSYRES